MQKIFDEVNSLDQRCYEKFALTSDILMENAALALSRHVQSTAKNNTKVLIVCGSGNNGADGITCARRLQGSHLNILVFLASPPKSEAAVIQKKRAESIGVAFIDNLDDLQSTNFQADIVVDALFGSGLSRPLNNKAIEIITYLNTLTAYKIACDIPSGIDEKGTIQSTAFKADITITMGALKTQLFGDLVKDYVGKVEIANLGISQEMYETSSSMYLLEANDLKLPIRSGLSTHKGDFGHVSIISGDKLGASRLAGLAALSFGAGLVTLVSPNDSAILEPELMIQKNIPDNCNVVALGMGLGNQLDSKVLSSFLTKEYSLVIDADMFYKQELIDLLLSNHKKKLKDKHIVLTPHPKEFCSLLKLTQLADISINELQQNRIYYVKLFTEAFPYIVLLLKGANTLIAQDDQLYINPLGNAVLSKAGSGDVLSGLIAALLAQKEYFNLTPLQAALQANLAHTLAARAFEGNNYALFAQDLISNIRNLELPFIKK
jgi:hydroxyethylthiazole kinase-like uncharacterized protein yjeF